MPKIKNLKYISRDNQICECCKLFDDLIVNLKSDFILDNIIIKKACLSCIHEYNIPVGNYIKFVLLKYKKNKEFF